MRLLPGAGAVGANSFPGVVRVGGANVRTSLVTRLFSYVRTLVRLFLLASLTQETASWKQLAAQDIVAPVSLCRSRAKAA